MVLRVLWQFVTTLWSAQTTAVMPLSRYQLAELLEDHINDGVVVQDSAAHILWANAAYLRMMEREMTDIIGKKPQNIVIPPQHRPPQNEIDEFSFDDHPELFEDYEIVQNVRGSGEMFWAQLSFRKVEAEEGMLVVCTSRDVTDQIEAQVSLAQAKAELEHAVNYDALTGLANRRKLSDYLDQALADAVENQSLVALFHIDLDKFKEINDAHGHAAGDAILIHAARAMEEVQRKGDLVARVGGDEFIIVTPNARGSSDAAGLAERIISKLVQPITYDEYTINCAASIGIALSEPGQKDGEELIQKADFALYEVKQKGRGAYAFYDKRLRNKHHVRKRMASDLKQAIQRDGLIFFFQPIVSIAEKRVVSIETLARWRHPRRGLVAPIHFLGMAEDMGLLRDVDLAAMRAAADALAQLNQRGHDHMSASFNASAHTLSGGGLTDQLIWTADKFNLSHRSLSVEVLETVFFGENSAETDLAEEIGRLVSAGFPTLLDDFGVGYAGLSHLAHLNVTGIKIDRSLVRTMAGDSTSEAIVRTIIRLAEELDLQVVAEGVEDTRIAHMLTASRCTALQGYGIARPMPLDQLLTWLDCYDARAFLTKTTAQNVA